LTLRREVALTIETATTIKPHLAATIGTWFSKIRLQLKQKTASKRLWLKAGAIKKTGLHIAG